MKTYPLKSINLDSAINLQFKVVEEITKVFEGHDFISRGDLGIVSNLNKPSTTKKVEQVIASIFDAESCILVRGAGTGAIRYGLFSVINPCDTILVHKAPIYNTTKTTIQMMGIRTVEADFNSYQDIKHVLQANTMISAVLIQYSRQCFEDSYDMKGLITYIKSIKDLPIITDDNYAVMKVDKIGTQCGADLSCFSTYKLLGPEGIGCVVGRKVYIDFIVKHQYSGGVQTQGFEALEVLKGMTYAPVSFAIQAEVICHIEKRLNAGEIPEVKKVLIANAQSKVLLVEFHENIAEKVLYYAEKCGAAPYPIGSESKYEIVPLFYRVSGSFLESDKKFSERMIRINPMRSGSETVINILNQSIKRAKLCS